MWGKVILYYIILYYIILLYHIIFYTGLTMAIIVT